MKALVTGGAGFIGSHLVDRLLNEGYNVTAIDNFDAYYDPKLKYKNIEHNLKNPNFRLIEGDIRDGRNIETAMNDLELIFHEAAQPGVRISVNDPIKTNDINIMGTLNVLETARKKDIKKIIFASSSSVYGKIDYSPFDENHSLEPISPYGASKVACEHLCKIFSDLYEIKIIMLRYFTVYGPRMRPDLAINKFMHNAISGKNLEIYGDGNKKRDITYIEDIVEANMLALKYQKTDVFNINGGNKLTVKEIAEKILSITKSKSKITYMENVKGDAEDNTGAINKKAQDLLKWKPKTDVDKGLLNYYNWLLKMIR